MSVMGAEKLGFLSARKLANAAGGAKCAVHLLGSGEFAPLLLYVRAHAARAGLSLSAKTLPFGTLGQALRAPAGATPELILLTPWDFVGELDWRSGLPVETPDYDACLAAVEATATLLRRRPQAAIFYLPAATPPIFSTPERDTALSRALSQTASSLGATILPEDAFGLASYLASGCPVAGGALEATGLALVGGFKHLSDKPAEPAKVLVTDLDNVMWDGVVGETGIGGIAHGPDGRGWRHFLYQTMLKRLRNEGVLIVAVSRNRHEDAIAPFKSGGMTLGEDDLVAVMASYHAKSAQIEQVARELNIGLRDFVFVDDSPIELAEVAAALPNLRCLAFPGEEVALPSFLATLRRHFARGAITDEDRRRTDLYRQRMASLAPVDASGSDITEFLRGLGMRMTIHDRSKGARARAVQLINKTNQFNLNGVRVDDAQVAAILDSGGKLLTATLADRTGSHGEILSLLVDADGMVESFVMSCRVFMRCAEYVFLMAVADAGITLTRFRYQANERNEPFATFVADPSFTTAAEGIVGFDAARFGADHGADRDLIVCEWSEPA
jgi:FkbH-like protein